MYATSALPVPLAADVIVSHEAWEVAVHAQLAPVVSLIDPVPARPPTETVLALSVNVQLLVPPGVGLGLGEPGEDPPQFVTSSATTKRGHLLWAVGAIRWPAVM